jgi:4'-phosphopantetheinyl transferase
MTEPQVCAWYAPTTDLARTGGVEAAVAWLTPSERQRFDRFRADADRLMFLLGRTMARVLVGRQLGVPPTSWRWGEGPRGRPEIAAPASELRFNLAHSAGLVACAIASGRDIGVDVEDLARRRIEWAVVERYCAPEEIADIRAQDGRWHDRFLEYWTLKEAYLKARGLGISVPLAEVGFRWTARSAALAFRGSLAGTDPRWTFRLDRVTDRHLVAVAVSTRDGPVAAVRIERLTGYLPS